MERAARIRAAGVPDTSRQEETPGEAELRRRTEQVDPASKADYLIRDAMMRGEFENLQYAGKPIPIQAEDPDWWVKGLIERENISGLGPPALLLRVEDAEFERILDAKPSAAQVRETVEDFNSRIIEARRQLLGGPPVITRLRDVELEVQRWRDRRAGKTAPGPEPEPRRPWWRRAWNRSDY